MTLTNRIENGIIATAAMIVTVVIFGLYNHYFVLKPLQNELEAQRNAIIRLAEIPKFSIENDFGKMKAKDGQVLIELDNKMPVQEINVPEPAENDSVSKTKFWKRLFQ